VDVGLVVGETAVIWLELGVRLALSVIKGIGGGATNRCRGSWRFQGLELTCYIKVGIGQFGGASSQ
jgi:hypothetical protein